MGTDAKSVGNQDILDAITDFYVNSGDFNGIPLSSLGERLKALSFDELKSRIVEFVKQGVVTLTFACSDENPHIRRFPERPIDQQIELLEKEKPYWTCVYPTKGLVEAAVDTAAYNDRPFTKRLLLCEAQLQPVFFELSVLERYYNDARYHFIFNDYCGHIHLADQFYESDETQERDKVFLQAFGLGYDEKENKIAVVWLQDLSRLSPEHQQVWNAHIIDSVGCTMCPDFYRNQVLGEWVHHGSIYAALLEEQEVINGMCKLMGLPSLFRETFTEERRPREFSLFLRPTLANYSAFILCLDKMLSDNINKAFFRNDIPLEDEEGKQKGTLTLLNEWLRRTIRVKDEAVFDKIIRPFREVRSLRQTPAHAIRENEYDPTFYKMQEDLVSRVYVGVRNIRLLFANHPLAKGYEIPEWLFEGRIVQY